MKPKSYDVTRTRNSWVAEVTGHGVLPVYHSKYWDQKTHEYRHESRVSPGQFERQNEALRTTKKVVFQKDQPNSNASAGYLGQTLGRNNAYVFAVEAIEIDGLEVSFRIVGRV